MVKRLDALLFDYGSGITGTTNGESGCH